MKKFDTDEETDDLLNDTSEETENEGTDENDIDAEEFERLLEEFIADDEEEESAEEEKGDEFLRLEQKVDNDTLQSLKPATINGRRVYIPQNGNNRIEAEYISVNASSCDLDHTKLVDQTGNFDDDPYIVFSINYNKATANYPTVYIYENSNRPTLMATPNDKTRIDELNLYFECAYSGAQGRYMILVADTTINRDNWKTIGNHSYIEFYIYNNEVGDRPKIIGESASFSKAKPHFTFSPLKITAQFEKPTATYIKLQATLFNEQLMVVAKNEQIVEADKKKMECTLTPSVSWKPGNYSIAFSIDEQIIHAARMTVSDDGKATFHTLNRTETRNVEKLYTFANMLQGKALLKFPLHPDDKLKLATRYADYQQLHPTKQDKVSHHYAVLSKSQSIAHRVAGLLASKMTDINSGVTFTTVQENISELQNQPLGNTNTVFFKCTEKNIVLGKDVSSLTYGDGKTIARQIVHGLNEKAWTLAIYCTEQEFHQVCRQNPSISRAIRLDNRFTIRIGGADVVANYLETMIADKQYTMSTPFLKRMHEFVAQLMESSDISAWEASNFEELVEQTFLMPHERRNPGSTILTAEDFDEQANILRTESFEECMKELDSLVGLKNLKSHMADSFALTRFTKMRQKFGLPEKNSMPNHMLFFGNPGTGKTTVAKMVGKIYRSMGLLSKGDVIETNRAGLVGRYIGDTEANTASIISSARGNVLFIDEAYTLFSGGEDRRDFGMRVIETLLPVMSEPDPDMVVIFAGYEKELMRMMDANEGLLDRFAHKFHFDDYSADELIEIGERQLKEKAMRLTPEAKAALKKIADDKVRHKDKNFSNARWIKNFIETGIQPEMAKRVMKIAQPTKDDLCRIMEEDVIKANERRVNLGANSRVQRPVGF